MLPYPGEARLMQGSRRRLSGFERWPEAESYSAVISREGAMRREWSIQRHETIPKQREAQAIQSAAEAEGGVDGRG